MNNGKSHPEWNEDFENYKDGKDVAVKAKTKRPERLKLSERRDMQFEKLRTNLRILRASLDISALQLSGKLYMKNAKRVIDIEYGRANPTLDELMSMTEFFKISFDDLMNKRAKIVFD